MSSEIVLPVLMSSPAILMLPPPLIRKSPSATVATVPTTTEPPAASMVPSVVMAVGSIESVAPAAARRVPWLSSAVGWTAIDFEEAIVPVLRMSPPEVPTEATMPL